MLDLPLRFEPNRGQIDAKVQFVARGPGYGLYLTGEGATLALRHLTQGRHDSPPQALHRRSEESEVQQTVISMHLVGGRQDVQAVGSDVQPGTSNYFVGNDPSRWRTGIEGYGSVRYAQVLPGVDLIFYGTGQRRLEYDVVLAAGKDAANVALSFDGVESITLNDRGEAVLGLPGDTVSTNFPTLSAFQTSERASTR